ncbi:MAG: glycosyltransferase family 4 protein [Actinobacteria bacterium]|nr:glycosyltransferase family 4 protein [Actinomycetota bacterium]
MHIAMLVDLPDSGRASGVERSTAAVVAGLRERGIRVTLLAPSRGEARAAHDDVTELDMGGRYQILRGFRPWISSAHRALRELEPDVVHGQGLLHNGIAASAWRDTPTVVTAHGDPVADARWHYRPITRPLLLPLLRRTATRVVTSADCIVNVAPDWRVNCPREPREWLHIPNPVDPSFFGTEDPIQPPRVLYFGGTRGIKGLDVLLDAWPTVTRIRPDATVHVWGMPRDDDARIAQRCRTTPACTLEGVATPDTVALEMHRGGVLVVPSRYEVAPLAIAEGWAVGIPVVATAAGGVSALAEGAATLCPAERPDELASAILAALERGPAIIARIAEGHVRADASRVAAVTEAHIALYERLLKGSRP